MKEYFSKTTRFDKFRLLCESGLSKEAVEVVLYQIPDSDEVKSYYVTLGPQRLKSFNYNITKIRKAMGVVIFSEELLLDTIYSEFKVGDKYIFSDLKLKLGDIYSSINYQSTPKANDIERWFEVKEVQNTRIIEGKKKRVRYYELLRSKEQELREELKLIG